MGDILGKFIKIYEQTKAWRHTTYERICVYMDLTKELPEAIKITWEDEDWVQTLDYEQIPLCCHRCHEYGHLFRDLPTYTPKMLPMKEEEKRDKGFTRVTSRKIGARK